MAHQSIPLRRKHRRLRALQWYASVSSWLDRARCLQSIDKIRELCAGELVPQLRVIALGQVGYWNLLFKGWDEADYVASAAAFEAAREGSDRPALALQSNRHSFFQSLSSQYHDAYHTAQEGVRTAIEIESLMDYSVGHFFAAFALFYAGEWDSMRRLLRSATSMANRNGHDFWVVLFGLLEAMLHLEASSFEYAHGVCADYLVRARELGHPLSVQISLVLLGKAQLGSGDLDAAQRTFDEVIGWQERERILMDWIWRLPLQFSYVELCLARNDIGAAIRASDLFLTQTARSSEQTWIGLAHLARARVAAFHNDGDRLQTELGKALRVIEAHDVPLAAWRLHAFAAQLGMAGHLVKGREIVRRLANGLAEDQELLSGFLSAPDVSALVGSGRHASAKAR